MNNNYYRNLFFIVGLIVNSSTSIAVQQKVSVNLESGISDSGKLTASWLSMIANRNSQEQLVALKESSGSLKREEQDWLKFFKESRALISSCFMRVTSLVPAKLAPRSATLIYANRGADDAFTAGTDTIGLDLSDWVSAYGTPAPSASRVRAMRILTHEFTHLITNKLRESLTNQYSANPWQRAIWELRNGISGGNFSDRWGALTIALWLSEETKRNDSAFGEWVIGGPERIVRLIKERLKITWM